MILYLVSCLKFIHALLFADDVKFYSIVRGAADAISFQQDLDYVDDWAKQNDLCFNLDKCSVISFSKHRSQCILFTLWEGLI